MKKTTQSKAILSKRKRSLKAAAGNGFRTQRLFEPGAELAPSEEITLPPPKRVSPAADEEM
jgi:hypothetical protein